MKAPLLALGMIATSMGFAQESTEPTMHTSSNGQCSSCCSTPCCCKPCCVPKPPKCIDCECYVPQHYDMSCDCGLFLSVDFLYFYGRESNLLYAAGNVAAAIPNQPAFVVNKLHYTEAEWDPGVRVGLGWKGECDGWDLSFFWTYYKSTSNNRVSGTDQVLGVQSSPGDVLFTTIWGEVPFEFTEGYSQFAAKWEFTFNSFDLELGRRFWLSKCFDLRPYFGLRGAWGETDFNLSGQGIDRLRQTTRQFGREYENDNWGVGFLGGLQPVWHFSDCFSLYSNFDLSLIWGKRKVEGRIRTFIGDDESRQFDINGSLFGMQTAFDLGLGLRYENCYCDNQYRFALDLGWEHHAWLDYNNRFTTERLPGSIPPPDGVRAVFSVGEISDHDVMFGGFVLRARFDF